MHIKEITSQHRRDFRATFECEHCGHLEYRTGYDDSYFHNNVIPTFKCGKCGKTAGKDYTPRATKYADYEVI